MQDPWLVDRNSKSAGDRSGRAHRSTNPRRVVVLHRRSDPKSRMERLVCTSGTIPKLTPKSTPGRSTERGQFRSSPVAAASTIAVSSLTADVGLDHDEIATRHLRSVLGNSLVKAADRFTADRYRLSLLCRDAVDCPRKFCRPDSSTGDVELFSYLHAGCWGAGREEVEPQTWRPFLAAGGTSR